MVDTYTLRDIFPDYAPENVMIDQLLYGSDDDHPAKSYLEEAPAPTLAPLTWTADRFGNYTLDWPDLAPSGECATRMNLDAWDYIFEDYRITKRNGLVRLHVRGQTAAVGDRALQLRYEISHEWTPLPRPVKFRAESYGDRLERSRANFYTRIEHRKDAAQALLDDQHVDPDVLERLDLDDKTTEELEAIIAEYEFYSFPEPGQWEYTPTSERPLSDAL